jgi:hypothetical protein
MEADWMEIVLVELIAKEMFSLNSSAMNFLVLLIPFPN